MQDEIERLRAQVTRLQADSTAELLKHRERKELLQKAQDQCFDLLDKYSDCLNKIQAEREEHRDQLAARDARVAELEAVCGYLNPSCSTGYCSCAAKTERIAALESGIAKFRAYLDDYSDVEDGKGDNPADVTPNWAMRCEMELDDALAGKGVSRG